jgi:hypothetical protein
MLTGTPSDVKSSSPPRPPPSAAAKARVRALLRGEAPVVHDPEEARGLPFVSPKERQAAVALEARRRAAKKKAPEGKGKVKAKK